MPKIDFDFEGYIIGADIQEAYNPKTGKDIDVSNMPIDELVANLKKGRLTISLGDYLYSNHRDSNIVISGFESSVFQTSPIETPLGKAYFKNEIDNLITKFIKDVATLRGDEPLDSDLTEEIANQVKLTLDDQEGNK